MIAKTIRTQKASVLVVQDENVHIQIKHILVIFASIHPSTLPKNLSYQVMIIFWNIFCFKFCILSLLLKKQRKWDQNVECCVNGAKFLVYVVPFLLYLDFDGLPILGMWHFSFGLHTIISTQKLKKENFRKTLLLMRVWKCEVNLAKSEGLIVSRKQCF